MKVIDFKYIKSLYDLGVITPETVYDWCVDVWKFKDHCILPPKVKMWEGESGRYITMPCVIPSLDIAGVKFISRNVDDRNGMPARNSNIMIQKRSKMGLLAVLDGIWITNIRTGAIAAHSVIRYGKSNMNTIGVMGLGAAAYSFMLIFGHVYKKEIIVKLLKYKDQAQKFVERFSNEFPRFKFELTDSINEICGCDAVISAVSFARSEFADETVFNKGCVVVPIHTAGFQNCDLAFDRVAIDDHGHVQKYKYYNDFKSKSVEMSKVENGIEIARKTDYERIIAYCGGIALHDIYIAYNIYKIACERGDCPEVNMVQPNERLWM